MSRKSEGFARAGNLGGGSPVGFATMSPAMDSAVRYARYLYDCVKRSLRPPILELGSGYGTYTQFLLDHGRVISVDIDRHCLARLQERYAGRELEIHRLDLNDHEAIRRVACWGCRSAFSTNVFEHIEDDEGALRALAEAMAPRGRLCLIVPAHPRLYGYMDTQAGHFRRYTRRALRQTLCRAGWQVRKTFYINALGGFGWWFNHRFFRPRPLDAPVINNQLRFYDRFVVPLARLTDVFFRPFFGLSVVAIARKAA